jgi:hypothetical protein
MNLDDKIKQKGKLNPSLYYINEEGLLVFTEQYHLQRGYCCGKTCLNCCFWPRYQKGSTEVKLKSSE